MIQLKLEHSHHLPCHPTRQFLEEQGSIHQTDRQHDPEDDDGQQNDFISNETPFQDYRTIQNKTGTSIAPTGSRMKLQLKSKKLPVFETAQEIYNADVIENHFQDSAITLPKNCRALIKQKIKLIQDKVYLGNFNKGSNVLERLYQEVDAQTHLKDQLRENLNEMMSDIQGRIEQDIGETDQYVIHNIIRGTKDEILKRKKDRKSQMMKEEAYSTGARKQGKKLQQKLNSFKQAMDDDSFASQSHPSQQDYNLNSTRTKKAEIFIRKMQKQKSQNQKKKRQKEEKKKSLEVRSMEEKRQFEKEIREQKRNYLRRKLAAKQQFQEKQRQKRQKMNQQYKQFLARYKKQTPLFRKKEKQYKLQSIEEETDRRQKILNKIRQQRKSMNFDDIKEHEKKYIELKSERSYDKITQKKLQDQKQDVTYFKGKFHSILADQEEKQKERQIKQDKKLIRSELIRKRDEYSRSVRDKFLPKGSQQKHRQLEQLMEKIRWADKLKKGQKDEAEVKEDGRKNLQRVHELIAELRKEGKLIQQSKTIEHSTKKNYANYLQELSEILHSKRYSVDYNKMAKEDPNEAKERAVEYEAKAKRRQLYVNGGALNINQTLRQTKKIDQEYLQSVKAKLAIINKLG